MIAKQNEKKRSERRKHCALREVRRSQKISSPPHTPFPGVQDRQNLISWRWSLPSPTDPVWWKLMHAISNYRDNRRPTHKQRPPVANTQTGPITIHCAAKLSAQCNKGYNDTRLMAVFQDNPGQPLPECRHSGFYRARIIRGSGLINFLCCFFQQILISS